MRRQRVGRLRRHARWHDEGRVVDVAHARRQDDRLGAVERVLGLRDIAFHDVDDGLRDDAAPLHDDEQARLLVVVERRGIVAETIVDLGPEDRLAKAEYALDGAQPVILAASVSYVDDESFVIPSGVATEPSDALPPHEAHPLPAHRTPFPKPLM